jgi:hypothetical protein
LHISGALFPTYSTRPKRKAKLSLESGSEPEPEPGIKEQSHTKKLVRPVFDKNPRTKSPVRASFPHLNIVHLTHLALGYEWQPSSHDGQIYHADMAHRSPLLRFSSVLFDPCSYLCRRRKAVREQPCYPNNKGEKGEINPSMRHFLFAACTVIRTSLSSLQKCCVECKTTSFIGLFQARCRLIGY